MKKKIIINLAIICIIFGGAFNAYAQVSLFSGGRVQLPVYAADNTPNWEPVNQNDLVSAFRYYCKSRNVFIEGSVADALTTFTTRTFNSICNTLGIDITLLQSELKKTYDNNLGQRFLFTHSGISLYNRIFAEFLQNNNLEVGDEVENKVLFSGKVLTDDEGNTCLLYVINGSFTFTWYENNIPSSLIAVGTPFKYYPQTLGSIFNSSSDSSVVIHNYFDEIDYPETLFGYKNGDVFMNSTVPYYWYSDYKVYTPPNNKEIGYMALVYNVADNSTYLCMYNEDNTNSSTAGRRLLRMNYKLGVEPEDTDVTVNTPNNTVINNNTYNNNYTIIYNDGDYYEDDGDDEPSPDTPPSGGGGGGGGGDDPDPDEPIVDPTPTPDPHIPDWDIELPDMPTGSEWLLYGMEKKFPWDIPYNLMFMLSLFAAEPETPHFEGTLDLKICQWNYDIDLEPFDNIARYVRDFEFIGFLIGLMLITRKLIWG